MDILCGYFGKHVQNQLGVGHIVAQVFFFQLLALLSKCLVK